MTTRNGAGQGSLPKVEELLAELINTQRLQQRLDFGHFLDWAIYNRFAYIDVGSYTLSIPGSSSFTLTSVNPAGYIWIPHVEIAEVETAGVISGTFYRDGQLFASFVLGSVAINTFIWQRDVPWVGPGAAKSTMEATWTNSDAADKWIIGAYGGTYLLYTEWQAYVHDLVQQYPRDWRKY